MFEEGVAAPPREVPAGVVSLRNRWKRVLRPCHAPFHARPPICATSHRRWSAGSCAWIRVQEEALRSGTDADASTGKRTDGASRLFGPREGGADGSVTSCVCHCDFKIISPTPLAFSTPLNFLLVVDHQRGFSVWNSVLSWNLSLLPPLWINLQNFFPFFVQYISNRCVLIQRGGRFKILYIYIYFFVFWFVTFSIPGQGCSTTSRRHKHSAVLTRESRIPLLRGEGTREYGLTSTPRWKRGKVF